LVDFPVENFKPNEHLGINEATDDMTYDLTASVNHHTQPNNGGHYTAICQQHESGRWYEYDDDQVNMANFIKMCHGVPTVKMKYQRAATILFYIKRSKPTSSSDTSNFSEIDEIDHSMNSHENSNRSRSSDNAKDDNNNAQNNVVICDVGCNSDRTRIEEVSIPVESTRLTCAWGMDAGRTNNLGNRF
jgi:uncharacterized UBP type Zn finger protein